MSSLSNSMIDACKRKNTCLLQGWRYCSDKTDDAAAPGPTAVMTHAGAVGGVRGAVAAASLAAASAVAELVPPPVLQVLIDQHAARCKHVE